jgi:arsenite-transporting ATPase
MLKNIMIKDRNPEYYFFGGKGGVGKTSIAAATALWFSKKGKKVLIISTDPAHSLSDSFEKRIGGELKKIDGNLYAVEIDPKKAMDEYKEKLMPRMEKIEFLKGLGMEDTFDYVGMTPGIDEMAAFDKFLQYMDSREYDVIIFDTAPTGHTLRFLSLPDVLDSWVGKMIKIRMRFAGIANVVKKVLPFGKPEEEEGMGTEQLEAMKKRIESAREILSDPGKTHYNMVMIPELMSIYESERSLGALRDYRIPVETIIVNQLIPENPECGFCSEKRKLQQERVREIKKRFSGLKILKLRMFRNEVKGLRTLAEAGRELYG